MDRTERFYKIDQLLRARRAVPLKDLVDEIGVSRATVKRDLEYLRDRLRAPIVWDRARRGYRYQLSDGDDSRYALPGMWFNASEVHALLTMEHLLSNLQPGLLSPHIEPLRSRIRMLLDSGDHAATEVVRRIRVLHMAARPVRSANFEVVTSAVLGRRRLAISHYNRRTDEATRREVSPQRLVHYRDNWYLDAWCHMRDALRSFALDAIGEAEPVNRKARNVPERVLDAELGTSYGIFAGTRTRQAVLRFTPEQARWVSHEVWHPEQTSRFDRAGYLVLEVPYSDDTELVMDILQYGPDVEVLKPGALRDTVREKLEAAGAVYRE